jgi:hypothetical protein
MTHFGLFHWTIIGPAMLVLLFLGSSTFGETISAGKYPLYQQYCRSVPKYIFWKRYVPKQEENE